MSGTRYATTGSPLRQERWASSPAHVHGLKANLVARRCQTVSDEGMRELIWSVQARSHETGGLPALADELAAIAPGEFGRTGTRLLIDWLSEFCLNPDTAGTPAFLSALRAWCGMRADQNAAGVVTRVGAGIHAALDYASSQRCMVVVEGVARIGKTYAVKHWSAARPGRVRYVQCPSTNDDVAFFTAIGKALGVTVEQTPKSKNLRPRIEDTLQSGDLMLVIDEGHYLWPSYSYVPARPARISWLMTALVNYNVPVAIIVTPQFFKAQKVCEVRTGWASEQFIGRIGDYVRLPDELDMEDLRAVAQAHLPEGDSKSIEALALYAGSSEKHLAAIEHAVKKARHLAAKDGRRTPSQRDLRGAIESGLVPSDSALSTALARAPGRPSAEDPRPVRRSAAGSIRMRESLRGQVGVGKLSVSRAALGRSAEN